jgi:basic membrane lipoprotein Med (substrate-binding protein (PBP1-ABC) superfamily)
MSKSSKWAVIIVAVVIIIAVAVGLRKPKEEIAEVPPESLKAAMVTDVGGLGDESFNDAAYKGLKEAEEKLGFEITVVESKKMDDYEPNLRSLGDQDTDISWAIGFLLTDAVDTVASEYPDLKFGLLKALIRSVVKRFVSQTANVSNHGSLQALRGNLRDFLFRLPKTYCNGDDDNHRNNYHCPLA